MTKPEKTELRRKFSRFVDEYKRVHYNSYDTSYDSGIQYHELSTETFDVHKRYPNIYDWFNRSERRELIRMKLLKI